MGRQRSQRAPRRRKRVSCELLFDERRYAGIVLDVSERGLFVQTVAKPKLGARVRLRLRLPGVGTTDLTTRVARIKLVPPRLLAVAQGGVGLVVEMLTPEFERLVSEARGSSTPG
jgi:Tfp pilus assembly protein PilZ